jgi:D-serine deaminase-like pyridoxal phosphate-dependent protein
MAGRKPGTPKTGGRKKGVPNKATADVKAAAAVYTQEALLTLAEIMTDPERPAAARVAAANSLLDRAHGKPAQAITGGDGSDLPFAFSIVERRIVDAGN